MTVTDRADEAPTRRRWGWSLVVASLLLVLLGVTGPRLLTPAEPLPGVVRTPFVQVDDLEFMDFSSSDAGEPNDVVPREGGVTLLYFGYLSCPDVCPTTLADIRVALQSLEEDAAAVDVAFVTVDPDRDDGPLVRRYLDQFYPDLPNGQQPMRAATPAELADAVTRLNVFVDVAEHDAGDEDYDVGHSAVTYVVDDHGAVVRELPFGATPDEFVRVLEAVLDGSVART